MDKIEMDNLLSVIVPIHNSAPFLEQCIKSILDSTYKKLDIILIDDGSQDESYTICLQYMKSDARIQCLHYDKNKGAVYARQRGIELAKGEYVTYVDSDDWIEAEMFEMLMKAIIESKADIAMSTGRFHEFSQGQCVTEDSASAGIYYGKEKDELIRKMIGREPLVWPTLVNKVYRKDAHAKWQLGMNTQIKVANDGTCVLMTVLNVTSIVVINQIYYHYRKNDRSITNSWSSDYLESRCLAYACIKNEIEKNGKLFLLYDLKLFFLSSIFWDIRMECSRYNKGSISAKLRRLRSLYKNDIINDFLAENGQTIFCFPEKRNEHIWNLFRKKKVNYLYFYLKMDAALRIGLKLLRQ